ncbi:16S rRNA (adenine(1518)-N(6)/adenine(1519)-N(6))-dimethyltransferase, partial [Pseudomonas vancouverensis]
MVKAKKQYGQNFLIDKSVLAKIIQAIPKEMNNIIEIGPGLGDLTQELLKIS